MREKSKVRFYLLLLTVLLVFLVIILIVIGLKQMSYDVVGTYSAGNEPSMDNVYLVLKDGQFVIYNPERLMEKGTLEKLEANDIDIYKLFSSGDNWKGYVIHRKDEIILFNFMDTEIHLKKISTNAIYTYK